MKILINNVHIFRAITKDNRTTVVFLVPLKLNVNLFSTLVQRGMRIIIIIVVVVVIIIIIIIIIIIT